MELWLLFKQKLKALVGHYKKGKYAFVFSYLHNRGKWPNLKAPRNLSEILISRVLNDEVNKIYYLADKYLMREYVEKKGYGKYLPKLFGVFDSADDIIFEDLPSRFALKLNYGAGMNIICTDKSLLNIDDVKKQLNEWVKDNGIYSYSERHYNLIKHKILCEEYIDDGKGGFPVDYKFMCVKGEPHCCLVCADRDSGQTLYLPYSLEWSYLKDWDRQSHSDNKMLSVIKPNNFGEMITLARELAQGIPFVRVDLYSDGNKIWIGEFTLTPDGCLLRRWSDRALEEMGDYYNRIGV